MDLFVKLDKPTLEKYFELLQLFLLLVKFLDQHLIPMAKLHITCFRFAPINNSKLNHPPPSNSFNNFIANLTLWWN